MNDTDKYLMKILPSYFTEIFSPLSTPADGNCLWHMVSRSLCGSCSLTNILKDMTVVTFVMLQKRFLEIMLADIKANNKDANEVDLNTKANKRFQKSIQKAKTLGEWGDEYHLLAISTFLGTKICIFNFYNSNFSKHELLCSFADSKHNKTGFHIIYTPIKITMFNSFKNNLTIYGYYDAQKQHYTSLIPQTTSNNIFTPKINLFKDFTES